MTTPIWISHRGMSQQHDENTRAAFELACDAGFSWLETDLHSTKDNHIILCHDPTPDKTSSCSGNIAEMTRAELEKIQLKKGGKYLFLDEFIVAFKKQHWVFDIKPDTAAQTLKTIRNLLIDDKTLLNKITFLFWNKELQENFLKDFPDAICFSRKAQCYQPGIAALFGLSMLGNIKKNTIYSIFPKKLGLALINKRVVQTFHQRGAQIIGFLPSTTAEVQLCLDAGVDYILSDDRPVSC
ncbi:MAG: glycerophosphodiester phosphodiesterase family protein [Thermodesulfobacteriota bacterium]|nr:glycerophosphodiester phosphodiesterase family protein [Thermodesulfobacteriota bacterium]